MNNNKGFTLVELMVVVAVIGILSAIAIPQFQSFQARSRSGEAKITLSGMYSALTSFEAEYGKYATCLNFMGFKPAGLRGTGASNTPGNANYSGISERYFSSGFERGQNIVPNITGCNEGNVRNVSYWEGNKIAMTSEEHIPNTARVQATASPTTFILGSAGIIETSNQGSCAGAIGVTTRSCYTMDETKRVITLSQGF